jgi:TRAP-type mannitol/chloroaromatic compound transport system permease large subunit
MSEISTKSIKNPRIRIIPIEMRIKLISLAGKLWINSSTMVSLSTGVICASGTLGQIIPPSIVLIILADVLGVPVGDLFQGAIMPSVVLVGGLRRWYNTAKTNAPTAPTAADSVGVAMPEKIEPSTAIMSEIGGTMALATLKYFSALPTTPTESAAVGAVGALVLAVLYQRLSWKMLQETSTETIKVTAMVFECLKK